MEDHLGLGLGDHGHYGQLVEGATDKRAEVDAVLQLAIQGNPQRGPGERGGNQQDYGVFTLREMA